MVLKGFCGVFLFVCFCLLTLLICSQTSNFCYSFYYKDFTTASLYCSFVAKKQDRKNKVTGESCHFGSHAATLHIAYSCSYIDDR